MILFMYVLCISIYLHVDVGLHNHQLVASYRTELHLGIENLRMKPTHVFSMLRWCLGRETHALDNVVGTSPS